MTKICYCMRLQYLFRRSYDLHFFYEISFSLGKDDPLMSRPKTVVLVQNWYIVLGINFRTEYFLILTKQFKGQSSR